MQPYLLAVNLNGMDIDGDRNGRKILYLAEGDREREMLRVIEDSGWIGPVGSDQELRRRDDGVHISDAGLIEVIPWLLDQVAPS